MKKLMLSLCLLMTFLINDLSAQNKVNESFKQPINERIAQFFDATAKKDWMGVLDLTYDSLFNLVPKEQMAMLFQQMEAEGMEINMGKFEVVDFIGQVDTKDKHFVNINYAMELGMKFSGESFSDENVMNYMKTTFETTYGAENVDYNKEESSFLIKANKNLFAIAPLKTQEWKFLENNAEQQVILSQIIPEEVRKSFE
ncbi:MAG: hypothetical protein HRU41_12705 [Saprospiraceae bacterium]|nr:hypothetical protein [Saprospiraceae bacterium]